MKYILFDMDGTVMNTKEGIVKSAYYALNSLGIIEDEPEKLERFIGPPLQLSFKELYQLNDKAVEKAIVKYRERYSVKGMFECKPYEGIEGLLIKLREKGKVLCIATSKADPYATEILKAAGLYKYFDNVSTATLDGKISSKKDVINLVKASFPDTADEDMVMVGDTKYDVAGAKETGIASIGVRYGFAAKGELEESSPDYIVDDIKGLEELLLNKL